MRTSYLGLLSALLASLALAGCQGETTPASGLKGEIAIDGSSTVSPISEAGAEEFGKKHSGVNVTVGTSGTGGGFKKFGNGEVDITGASRPIKPEEVASAKANGIEFVEIPIAFDGLTVVVNKDNAFVDHLTVAELKKIWEPESKVKTWSQVRAGWPAEEIKLYGPGTDSGTFDYFTEAIMGEGGASRSDYTASENDNVLVQGVAGDEFSLGYFGFSYYQENEAKLKSVPIVGESGQPVSPTKDTIGDGSYQPLSRPLFLYVSLKALEKPAVVQFLDYIQGEGLPLIDEVGYVPLSDEAYDIIAKHLADKRTGTVFHGAEVGVGIEEILKRESK